MKVLDLCQPHYQVLLIIYLKFTAKNVEIKICESKCNFIRLKNNKFHYKCNEFKKRQFKPINGLFEKFSNTYRFCNGDINKFVLLLRKGIYPYKYIDSWERIPETLLPEKNSFYIELYLQKIPNKNYTHAQKEFAEFKFKNLND